MAKKVTGMIKLQLPAGKATPAPPVGPALGQHGVNIMGIQIDMHIIGKDILYDHDTHKCYIQRNIPHNILIRIRCNIDNIGCYNRQNPYRRMFDKKEQHREK